MFPLDIQALLQPQAREGITRDRLKSILASYEATRDVVASQVEEIKAEFEVEFTRDEMEKMVQDIRASVSLWLSTGNAQIMASLIGDPIIKKPEYKPLYPLLLKGVTKSIEDILRNGLYYEDEVEVKEAISFDPDGEIVPVHIKGNRQSINPQWIRTENYTITLTEWLDRLVNIILIKKKQLSQELDKKIDRLLLALFDAAVPTAHKVSSGSVLTWPNLSGGIWKLSEGTAADIVHDFRAANIVVGFDELVDMEGWNTSFNSNGVWSEEKKEELVEKGIRGRLRLSGAQIVENPLFNDNKVRIFAPPKQVGYFVACTLQGKKRMTWGQTASWEQSLKTNQPPSFSMNCGALQAICLSIINADGLAEVDCSGS